MTKDPDDLSHLLPDTIPQWLQDMVNGASKRDLSKYKTLGEFYKETDVVKADKFDRMQYNTIRKAAEELNEVATERWTDDPTWFDLIKDVYLGLYKARPDVRKQDEMKPEYRINHTVYGKTNQTREWPELRSWTELDEWAAAMATVEIAEKLGDLFDEQKELNDARQDANEKAQELADKLAEAGKGGSGVEDAEQFLDELEEAMDAYGEATESLDTQAKANGNEVRKAVRDAMKEALEDAEGSLEMLSMFGTEPGQLKRIPHEARMELAQRIRRNRKLRELADKIGRFVRLAMGEQARKLIHGVDEVHDIMIGDDIHRLLPSELALLSDEDTEFLFYKKLIEHQLMQYELRGTEKVARGAIIAMIDTSGSMYGSRETWAKAVAIALLNIARKQGRSFYGILFGSSYDPLVEYQFDAKKSPARVRHHRGETHKQVFDSEVEAVLEFAEYEYGGGTDFETPITRAIDVLRGQYDDQHAQRGDLVMITDGECSVGSEWLTQYELAKQELAFRHYGCLIGVSSRTLDVLCDSTYHITELAQGDDAQEMFGLV